MTVTELEPVRPIEGLRSKAITGTALGLTALVGYGLQKLGYTNDLTQPIKAVAESISHPFPGWLGAVAGYTADSRLNPNSTARSRIKAMVVGAVLVNLCAEIGREAEVYARGATPKNGGFYMPESWGETAKDALGAMCGAAVATWQLFGNQLKHSDTYTSFKSSIRSGRRHSV